MPLGTFVLNKKAQRASDTPLRVLDITVPGDGAYPTGGSVGFQAVVRAAAALGKESLTILSVQDIGGNATHYPVYDAANDTLKMFVRTTGVEVANTTNMSGTNFRLLIIAH